MAVTPTTITTEDQIYLMGSESHIRVRNEGADATIKSAVLDLYIWTGNLNAPPSDPTQTLSKNKVSVEDNYIDFKINEVVSSYIHQTKFGWNKGNAQPSIAGEGVFFQFVANIKSEGNVNYILLSNSKFATLGYRERNERTGTDANFSQPFTGLKPINYNRNYAEGIKYFKREFDFTKSLGDCTSENIIKSTAITPSELKCQLGDKWLIVYINRLGLFDYFTPLGKAVKKLDVESEDNERVYRNFNSRVSNVLHENRRNITDEEDGCTINTGALSENMTEQVKEVIKSPLVYLIEFTGDKFSVTQIGTTVDSTLVTVDSTVITVDSQTVTASDVGLFDDYEQIPVINYNKSFIKKTRLNDKSKINYDLTFKR